ncbi:putative ribonuclease H-like domain-containing protein [Tanacetum coccineum]
MFRRHGREQGFPADFKILMSGLVAFGGKFVGKSDEGFLFGYSLQSKAFRVYNLVTKRVEENLHIKFLENKPNVAGKGLNWLFDLDYLTDSMNYHSVRSENQANLHAGQQESDQNTGTTDKIDAGDSEKEDEFAQDCFELLIWHSYSSTNPFAPKIDNERGGPREEEQVFLDDLARLQRQEKEANEEAEALRKNLEQETKNLVTQARAAKSSGTNIFSTVSPIAKTSGTNFVNTISIPVSTASANERLSLSETTNSQEDDSEIPSTFRFLSINLNTRRISEALEDEGWVDVMRRRIVCSLRDSKGFAILVDCRMGKRLSVKNGWFLRNKKDERGVVVRNKARLVCSGTRQEGRRNRDYDEVFASGRLGKAIRYLFSICLVYGVYSLSDGIVKSAFSYGKIKEEKCERRRGPYWTKISPKEGTNYDIVILVQVYVDDIIFGSTKKSWCDKFEALMKSRFQMSSMGELTFFLGLQVKQKPNGIFISQDKYVAEILKKFDFASVKTTSTPIETQNPLVKDEEAQFQVTPKSSHLSAVKRIFSDYAGANLDRKSTTGGCQFLGRRLITWQCKKQTIVATSTTEAEYVAVASCCGQNPVYHSKTKHIAIRHHFIRDAYEKKLIQVLKIHTNDNVADLLTKAFDSKKIAQVVSAWIKSKNSLVKHFEDMRLCRPSKEYLLVQLVSMVDDEGRSQRFRESLRRVTDGAEAFLILTLFILCLDKVSTDHAKLVPLGKVTQTYKNPFQSHTYSSNLSNCHSSLQALISLTDDLSLLSNMAALESCPKHNMIAYLEKTEGNVEFHEVIDFLRRSYIFHALTVSPVVSTTFVEQFWTSAKSKTINNVRHITAKIAGKVVSISEASIRTDLNFDDADGIDSLPNQAIFNAIQRMGYEGDLSDEGASSERLSVEQPSPSPAPTGEIPNESLPDSSSAQPSEVPFEQQPEPSPTPSPRPSPTPIVPDSIPEPTGENLGDHSSNDASLSGNEDDMTLQNVYDLCISLCQQVSDQAKEIKLLKAKITKLKKQAKPVIKHHKEYLKIISLQQRFPKKSFSKKQRVHKKYVSKQGRKKAKGKSEVQRDPLFEVLPKDKIDHMETENAQTEGRTSEMVEEEKEFDEELGT